MLYHREVLKKPRKTILTCTENSYMQTLKMAPEAGTAKNRKLTEFAQILQAITLKCFKQGVVVGISKVLRKGSQIEYLRKIVSCRNSVKI